MQWTVVSYNELSYTICYLLSLSLYRNIDVKHYFIGFISGEVRVDER